MQSKTLIVLSAVAILGVSSTAMARGVAMHAGGSGMAIHGHRHFIHHFRQNSFLFGGWTLWRGKHHCCGFPAGDPSSGRGDWLNSQYAVSLE